MIHSPLSQDMVQGFTSDQRLSCALKGLVSLVTWFDCVCVSLCPCVSGPPQEARDLLRRGPRGRPPQGAEGVRPLPAVRLRVPGRLRGPRGPPGVPAGAQKDPHRGGVQRSGGPPPLRHATVLSDSCHSSRHLTVLSDSCHSSRHLTVLGDSCHS